MYWLGIDVGTGGTRALLVDRQGRVVDSTAPEPAQAELYARGHQVYGALYPALRPLFPRM